ncbi:MAG: ribonuclease/clavin/mitogillin [Myxococcota bacterium]
MPPRLIAPGLSVVPVRSPTLPPATHTNAWLLGSREVVVVDPAGAWAEPRQHLADELSGLTVAAIFLTHHHLDHIGGVEDLRKRTGAPVLAHAHTAAQVDFPVDQILDEGDVVKTDAGDWTVLHTPGHARGHLCLHGPGGYLVAGDMVAGEGTIVLDPPEGNLGDYLTSLERLRAMNTTALLPAHGPELTDPTALLTYYINHRHSRTVQVQDALRQVGRPAQPMTLVPIIYPDIPTFIHPIAARQVLCHLQWLQAQGAVTGSPDGFALSA